jgi:hypothetical protein
VHAIRQADVLRTLAPSGLRHPRPPAASFSGSAPPSTGRSPPDTGRLRTRSMA